jgi:GTPase SAR1 family protein
VHRSSCLLLLSIRRGGSTCVKEFVVDLLESGNVPWGQAKIMVLGREGIGKTQLYHSVRNLRYKTNLSTEGIDVHRFSLLGLEVRGSVVFHFLIDRYLPEKLNWFDMGGQAVFYPTHQFFLTAQCICLVMFRLDDPNYFTTTKYWLRLCCTSTAADIRPSKIVVLGTHSDRVSEEAREEVWKRLQDEMDRTGHVVGFASINCIDDASAVVKLIKRALKASKVSAVCFCRLVA